VLDKKKPEAIEESSTLAEATDALTARGFTDHFRVVGRLCAVGTGEMFRGGLVIRAFRPFEGVSDPDERAIVYAIEGDHVRGTLTDAYGVYADPETGAVLARIRISLHALV
jgi:hypothetical protein